MFDKLKRFKDPVRGTGLVVKVNSSEGGSGLCRMTLVVEAPGVPKTTVKYSKEMSADKWPSQGVLLPITVDRADPTKVRVEWDEIKGARQTFEEYKERKEQRLLDKAYGRTPAREPGMPAGFEDVDPAAFEYDPELKELVEQSATAGAAPDDAPGSAPDVAERLRELDQLKTLGVLNEQEYQEQRSRIIQSI